MNPTWAVLEERIAALEGGAAALVTASGQSAETLAILNIAESGDHILSSTSLYGGTYNLFHYTLPKMGIQADFVDPGNPDDFRKAITPKTKLIFTESLGNPKNDVHDIEAIAAVAHEAGIPLIVDNTVATPYLLRPFDYGADIVVHSLTKFLGGHGTSIGGIIVDGGQLRLDQRQVPRPDRARPELPRPPVRRGLRQRRPTSSRRGSSSCATSARPSAPSTPF